MGAFSGRMALLPTTGIVNVFVQTGDGGRTLNLVSVNKNPDGSTQLKFSGLIGN